MFGDFEAQRHWMAVALHVPLNKWYTHNLGYWGLDYPPLTAYWAAGWGAVARWAAPDLVLPPAESMTSGVPLPGAVGEAAHGGRLLMRASVFVGDFVVYIPAVAAWLLASRVAPQARARAAAPLLLLPALVAVDHGHFQYNSVSLGLALAAAAASVSERELIAAALFALALNYKQMLLFFSPVFFVWLLGRAFAKGLRGVTACGDGGRATRSSIDGSTVCATLAAVASIGAVVVSVFAAVWSPFCLSTSAAEGGCAGGLAAVLRRQFPLARNVFEDKVGSLWCALEPALGVRAWLMREPSAAPRVAATAAAVTAALMAPALPPLWRMARAAAGGRARGAPQALALAMLAVSASFFLGGFQVHEKSILMPALAAAACLAASAGAGAGTLSSMLLPSFVSALSLWSLWPLLLRDGQLPRTAAVAVLAAVAAAAAGLLPLSRAAVWRAALADARLASRSISLRGAAPSRVVPMAARMLLAALAALVAAAAAVSAAAVFAPPPRSLPDLWPYLTAVVACAGMLLTWLWAAALLSGIAAQPSAAADT